MDGAEKPAIAMPTAPVVAHDHDAFHTVGCVIQVPNDGRRGPGPPWVAAIVTDVHREHEGSLTGGDRTVFLAAVLYPQVGWAVRGDTVLSFSGEGISWRSKPKR